MLMERIPTEPFPGDPDANRAVHAVGSRIREHAELTKRIAIGRFRDERERQVAIRLGWQQHADLMSRARSGGIVDHQMDEFFDAALRAAEAKFRCRLALYKLPAPQSANQPDERLGELRAAYANAELAEQAAERRAGRASATQRDAVTLENARDATRSAKAALDHHQAQTGTAR